MAKPLPKPTTVLPNNKKAKTKRTKTSIHSLKSKFFVLQKDTQLLLDDGRDAMKRSKNQDYAYKLVQKLCSKIEQMRGVVYDIVESERELFKLECAKDEADMRLMYLSPIEFDAAVNHNVPVEVCDRVTSKY